MHVSVRLFFLIPANPEEIAEYVLANVHRNTVAHTRVFGAYMHSEQKNHSLHGTLFPLLDLASAVVPHRQFFLIAQRTQGRQNQANKLSKNFPATVKPGFSGGSFQWMAA